MNYTNDTMDLKCYRKNDFASNVEFLYIFSSTLHYIITIVSVFGILMNATGIYILSITKSMKNTFHFLLIGLYCYDTSFLISHIFLNINLKYNRSHGILLKIGTRFIKLLYSAAFNASIFMIVAISHERFIAMRYPLVHHQLMESKRNRRFHFLKYFLPILVLSIFLVIPEYMKFEFVWELENATGTFPQDSQHQR